MLSYGCGKAQQFIIEPENGVKIRVSGLKRIKSQGKIFGFVEIENRSDGFVRLSNQELFLFCGNDSARAFMKMPGDWEIDKGLINILKGKVLRYQAYWPLSDVKSGKELSMRYVRVLEIPEE